jgi:hypothetical protein
MKVGMRERFPAFSCKNGPETEIFFRFSPGLSIPGKEAEHPCGHDQGPVMDEQSGGEKKSVSSAPSVNS